MLDLFKDAVGSALDHSDTIRLLLKDYFNAEAIRSVSDGRLLISEDVIRSELMHVEEMAAVMKELHCGQDGILILLEGKHHGLEIEAQIRLQILRLILTESTQTLVLHVTEAKRPLGKNLLGKIVCGVGNALIGNLTRYALKNCDLGEYTTYDEQKRLIEVRLDELPNVQRLLQPQVGSWKDSVPLRLLGVQEAIHVAEGVEMRLVVSPALRLAGERLSTVAEAAQGVLSWITKT